MDEDGIYLLELLTIFLWTWHGQNNKKGTYFLGMTPLHKKIWIILHFDLFSKECHGLLIMLHYLLNTDCWMSR